MTVSETSPVDVPAQRPRLVATDLDGTLLDANGEVSGRTREVLAALDDLGVPVVFTTGRPIRWMESLWESVGGHGLAILSNGGIVFDVPTHTVRSQRVIPREVLLEIGDVLRTEIPGTTFAVEKTTGFSRESAFMTRMHRNADPSQSCRVFEDIVDDDVVKLLARHEELGPEDFWNTVEKHVGDRVTTTWSSLGTLVEMSGHGVTKASTLQMLCDELGIDRSEVVAFGDMPNDLQLLEWAGASYAMANAHASVVDRARFRCGHHDEDGVAEALAAIFDL
ncbi:Cof-type HAD-IIB family hydrolase [Nocardioides yefusunii]|uniref:Cof-type HAD-IIB family hydrolase n=1 Tax=Nocardioides yefusunii TaxID=2500546 RepID=A0ABW1R115_9ACTN|nr:Cof-type HAD-IIB family hydrolase [Nocardioides yefusunii]